MEQKDLGANNYTKEELFGTWLKRLKDYVGGRKNRIKRATHAEKIDKDSASLGASKYIVQLEEYLYNRGIECHQRRSVFASLRDRVMFLFSTKGLLRGETFFQAELSDILHFDVEDEEDTSALMILILQFTLGKVSKGGKKLYGRVARHKGVRYCAVRAVALYLAYRFHHTKEMEGKEAPNFNVNSTWFEIKFLVDSISKDNTHCMNDITYSNLIRKACKDLGIPWNHWLHIGRVLGTREAEENKMKPKDVRITGNWDAHVVEKCYSARIPMTAIRQRAGFLRHNGLCHNVRTLCLPCDELTSMVFPWINDARDRFMAGDHADRQTAKAFFTILDMFAIVVVQDAAVTRILHPKRWTHSAYKHLPMFNAPATKLLFDRFTKETKQTLEETKAPHEKSLEACIPAIAMQLTSITSLIKPTAFAIQR